MSTRANIVIKQGKDKLWFYRHCDGYPETTLPLLKKFMKLIKNKKIRNNLSQACGWLILIGAQEYNTTLDNPNPLCLWKVGSIEPTTEQHGDIAYLYTIDLNKKTLTHKKI